MQLSAQTIHLLAGRLGMITPFCEDKVVVNGKSAGLSAASYDMTIGHDLTLGVNPSIIIAKHVKAMAAELAANLPYTSLAHTHENLNMPNDVAAQVADKSSYARVFCSAFNTFIDPGFRGNLTLELVNHGDEPVVIKAGDPIVQLLFTALDAPTQRPYRGKYQDQTVGAHPARHEAGPEDNHLPNRMHDFTPTREDPLGIHCKKCGAHIDNGLVSPCRNKE